MTLTHTKQTQGLQVCRGTFPFREAFRTPNKETGGPAKTAIQVAPMGSVLVADA